MEYIRVTEVLKQFSEYESIPKNILDAAAHRGTAVHKICAGIASGAWVGVIDDTHVGYVDSFKLWSRQVKDFVIVEQRFFDDVLGITGQIDLVVTDIEGITSLVDLKTCSKPRKTHAVQLAAYNHLLQNHGVDVKKFLLVYLQKAGNAPVLHEYTSLDKEWMVFQAALKCYKFFSVKDERNSTKNPN